MKKYTTPLILITGLILGILLNDYLTISIHEITVHKIDNRETNNNELAYFGGSWSNTTNPKDMWKNTVSITCINKTMTCKFAEAHITPENTFSSFSSNYAITSWSPKGIITIRADDECNNTLYQLSIPENMVKKTREGKQNTNNDLCKIYEGVTVWELK